MITESDSTKQPPCDHRTKADDKLDLVITGGFIYEELTCKRCGKKFSELELPELEKVLV